MYISFHSFLSLLPEWWKFLLMKVPRPLKSNQNRKYNSSPIHPTEEMNSFDPKVVAKIYTVIPTGEFHSSVGRTFTKYGTQESIYTLFRESHPLMDLDLFDWVLCSSGGESTKWKASQEVNLLFLSFGTWPLSPNFVVCPIFDFRKINNMSEFLWYFLLTYSSQNENISPYRNMWLNCVIIFVSVEKRKKIQIRVRYQKKGVQEGRTLGKLCVSFYTCV